MNRTRDYTLDLLKVAATFCVVCHHYHQVCVDATGTNFASIFNGNFYWGNVVELFFLISGFCMLPYLQRIREGLTFFRFYARRAARLLPLMALSGLVCAVLEEGYQATFGHLFLQDQDPLAPSLFGLVLQALGMGTGWGFADPWLNNPTWYCCILLLCYIVFYMIVYWCSRWKISPYYGFVFFTIFGCGITTYGINLPFVNPWAARGYSAFFAGVLLARAMPALRRRRWPVVASLAVLAAFAAEYRLKNGAVDYMWFTLTYLVYPALLVLLQRFPLSRITALPLWGAWARISYGCYIWHIPFYMAVYIALQRLGWDLAPTVTIGAMVLLAVLLQGVALVSYHLVEQPLNRFVLQWLLAHDPAGRQTADRVAV